MKKHQKLLRYIRRATLVVTVTALTTACVSQNRYDELAAEKEALEKQNIVLEVQQRELFATTAILSQEVDLLDEEVAILEIERAELEIVLETLLLAGNIKMELLESGLHILMENDVLFRSGSADIKPEGRQTIAALASELEQVPYQIVVIGHTDNVPIGPNVADQFATNWALAAARAAAVVEVMQSEGIPQERLVAVSFGDTRPIASNKTAEGRSSNRRIEVRLRPVTSPTQQ